ncbi:alpha/beta fold family hydrolase [Nitzschia inconspicua]|uniref:Alpha/beta fold family hydrolase n=1 Tax=Nitzschia inconspicua TaxID=303405 RepID=A0A9K3LPZ9_9STRA|nr:alpha/beta fold family hydrolase [Nitzschia inconspicua]
MSWSMEDYCQRQQPVDLSAFRQSTQEFLFQLNLPSVHPFCDDNDFHFDETVPPMGPIGLERFRGQNLFQCIISMWFMIAPPLLAMAELWLRLFAGAFGPIGFISLTARKIRLLLERQYQVGIAKKRNNKTSLSIGVILTVASSLVLMTDTLYVLENGPAFGSILFIFSVLVAMQTCLDANLEMAAVFTFGLVLLSIQLTWDGIENKLVFGNKVDQVNVSEGLYFSRSNELVSRLVSHWPESYRRYDFDNGATQWLKTGDSRTGVPFLLNHLPKPNWHRFFLEVDKETKQREYIALDISFPSNGYDFNKPVYMVLHGLNGGSDEEYIRDLTYRRNAENSTVIVMVARGLMDLPLRGWSLFNGARTSDAQSAATAIRKAIGDEQALIGVGYSMGAIVLSNFVASYGPACSLDGAVAISGGLDMRYQEHFSRAQRLWQPMLSETLREDFLLGKWGRRVMARLSNDEFLKMTRATHVTEIDGSAVVPYNGFDSLEHYYREMSALGDIEHEGGLIPMENDGKIHNVSIPMLIVHAYDDPLITWRSTCQNEGFMHPENLANTGSGNLILLLTKGGGHVGWPLGWVPSSQKWRWMSDISMSFASALSEAKGFRPVL